MTLDGTSGITQMTGSIVMSGSTSGTTTIIPSAVAGSNTATLPAATGTVMVSGNMPAFSAYGNTATPQAITTATLTKVLLPNTNFDTTSGMFASSRFTPTIAGYYIITAGVGDSTGASTGIIQCFIYKNSTRYAFSASPNNTGGSNPSLSQIIYFNGSTDQVELYINQTSGSSMNVGGTSTASQGVFLTGSMVRSA